MRRDPKCENVLHLEGNTAILQQTQGDVAVLCYISWKRSQNAEMNFEEKGVEIYLASVGCGSSPFNKDRHLFGNNKRTLQIQDRLSI